MKEQANELAESALNMKGEEDLDPAEAFCQAAFIISRFNRDERKRVLATLRTWFQRDMEGA